MDLKERKGKKNTRQFLWLHWNCFCISRCLKTSYIAQSSLILFPVYFFVSTSCLDSIKSERKLKSAAISQWKDNTSKQASKQTQKWGNRIRARVCTKMLIPAMLRCNAALSIKFHKLFNTLCTLCIELWSLKGMIFCFYLVLFVIVLWIFMWQTLSFNTVRFVRTCR